MAGDPTVPGVLPPDLQSALDEATGNAFAGVGAGPEVPETPTNGDGDGWFIDPQGQFTRFTPEQAVTAGQYGYTPASPEQIQAHLAQQAAHEKYGSMAQQGLTLLESTLDGLTFGGSRYAEDALSALGVPGISREEQRARLEENPITGTVGNVLGAAAPIVLSGGAAAGPEAGLLARAAAKTAPGLVAKAGTAVEGATRSALGLSDAALAPAKARLAQIAARGLAVGAGSAVEGAAYALGHEVSESALGDPAFSAEGMAATVGLSSLLGFGVGAGGSTIWNLGKKALGATSLADTLQTWLGKAEGEFAIRGTGSATKSEVAKVARVKGGVDGVRAIGRDGEKYGFLRVGDRPEDVFERTTAAMKDMGSQFEQLDSAIDGTLLPAEQPHLGDVFGRWNTRDLGGDTLQGTLQGTAAKRIDAVKDMFQRRYGTPMEGGNLEAPMTFHDLHAMRQEVDKAIYGIDFRDPDRTLLTEKLHDLRHAISDTMEDTLKGGSNLGADALREWKALNREYEVASTLRWFANKGMERELGNHFFSLTDKILGAAGAVAGAGVGEVTGEGEEGEGVGATLGLVGGLMHGHLALDTLAPMIGSKFARRYVPGILAKGAHAAGSALGRGAPTLWPGAGGAAAANVSSAVAEKLMRSSTQEGALRDLVDRTADSIQVGRARGFAEGGVVPGTADATPIGDDPEKVAVLATIERMNSEVRDSIAKGVTSMVNGSSRGPARGESEAGVPSSFGKDVDAQTSLFNKRVAFLNALKGNPEAMQETLTRQTDGWHGHAPMTGQALNTLSAQAVAYLSSKIPEPPPSHGALDTPWQPSRAELARFNTVWEAAQKPLAILKQAAVGTVQPDAVETVKTLYPHLMAEVQAQAHAKIADARTVPYSQKLAMSFLFGAPMTGTLQASMLRSNAATYESLSAKPSAQVPQQGAPGAAKPAQPKQPGAGKQMHANARMQTGSQAAANRGGEGGKA